MAVRLAFTFELQGSVEGTSAGLPFGTPRRDDHKIMSGSNPALKDEFGSLINSAFIGRLAGTDTLVGGIKELIGEVVKAAAIEAGKAGATAMIAVL